MLLLLLLVSAFLVAGGVFQVDASPEDDYATMVHQRDVFSKVTPESLSETFRFKDGFHITNTLAHILVSLSRDPRKDGMYYMMADPLLLELIFQKIAPKFVFAWIAMCCIVDKERAMRANKASSSINNVITDVLKGHYGEKMDPELKATFYDLAPLISNAIKGNVREAEEIVSRLAKHFDDFEQLSGIDAERRNNILVKVNKDLHHWGDGGLDSFIEIAKKKSRAK